MAFLTCSKFGSNDHVMFHGSLDVIIFLLDNKQEGYLA